MHLENIISVCALKDIDTWSVASLRIIKYIQSSNYTLIVPEKDLKAFRMRTPRSYSIISENNFIDENFAKILAYKARDSINPIGWYIQQFIKLAALEKVSENGLALIWDADTVPLKKLCFEDNGIVKFYQGTEYHEPYFDVINNLLGLRKGASLSYIAQCIPCKGRWAKELFKIIEERTGKNWKIAIVDCINFNKQSGLSEYETIGTFVQNKFPNEIQILNKKWQRFGNGLIGSVNNLDSVESILRTPNKSNRQSASLLN